MVSAAGWIYSLEAYVLSVKKPSWTIGLGSSP